MYIIFICFPDYLGVVCTKSSYWLARGGIIETQISIGADHLSATV